MNAIAPLLAAAAIPLLALLTWRWDRLAGAGAGVLIAFRLIHPSAAVAAVLAGLALRSAAAYRRGRALRLHGPEPRIIGAGLSARTPAAWRTLLRESPVRTALASRFLPGHQEAAFAAAACTRAAPAAFSIAAAVSWCLWTLLFVGLSLVATVLIAAPAWTAAGPIGLIAGILLALWLPRPIALLLTRDGRRRLRTAFHRAVRREYWPATIQYALLAPVFVRLGLRHGPATFTCCNPGISGGGGMVGESKRMILESFNGSALNPGAILPAQFIPPGEAPARARAALDAIGRRPELGGFPIILKPDEGQRGFALRLARSPADLEAYFAHVRSPVLLQRYHPGPHECGVLWVREAPRPGLTGRIFSITRKTFPVVTGDGRRTLEDLIHAHPRFHCQAHVFLERFADQRTRVLAPGETLRLGLAGNHCQGTLFSDGADLITPDLEAAIDAIASSFAGGLDMGRFDLRYESDEALRQGRGFAVVELNGTAGESTNIYDPDRSLRWACTVLAAQWRLLYRLGAERRAAGGPPLPLLALVRQTRRHFAERSGSAVSD